MHILLADESNLVRGALKLYLEQLQSDIKVSQAEAFHEALDLAASAESVDLIILDLHMPGANGLAGFDIMRERFPRVPVVLISGKVRREEVLEALGHGAAGFIPKTLNGRALLGALQLVLAGEKFIPSLAVSEADAKRADGPNGLPDGGRGRGPVEQADAARTRRARAPKQGIFDQGDRPSPEPAADGRGQPPQGRLSQAGRD